MRHNNKQRRKKSEFSSKHIKLLTELLTFFKLNQSAIECDSFWMTIFLSIVNIQLTSLLFRLKRTKIVRMVLHLNYFKIQSSIFFFFRSNYCPAANTKVEHVCALLFTSMWTTGCIFEKSLQFYFIYMNHSVSLNHDDFNSSSSLQQQQQIFSKFESIFCNFLTSIENQFDCQNQSIIEKEWKKKNREEVLHHTWPALVLRFKIHHKLL